jgi:hypothetical protein
MGMQHMPEQSQISGLKNGHIECEKAGCEGESHQKPY